MIEKISLNGLKFFYYIATYGSVTAASKKLFVTQSAVSKQLINLEQSLGVTLFDRVGKKLVLTPEGDLLLASCQQVFIQLDECLTNLSAKNMQSEQLVLSCEPTISMKWLIPRLSAFNKIVDEHDLGFEIVLLTAGGQVDFQEKDIDIALRRNDFDWQEDIYSEKIVDEYVCAVYNPRLEQVQTLLLSSSRPNLWHQLTKATLFEPTASFEQTARKTLNNDYSDFQNRNLLTYERLLLDHFYLCIEGALAGLGTAVVSMFMVEKELSNGLLTLAHSPVADGSAYHLLSPTPFDKDERKVVFKDWLKQEMLKSRHDFLNQSLGHVL